MFDFDAYSGIFCVRGRLRLGVGGYVIPNATFPITDRRIALFFAFEMAINHLTRRSLSPKFSIFKEVSFYSR